MKGSSNYAFNLIQKNADLEYSARLMHALKLNGIEFRRGSAGGGNQLRQPYLRNKFGNLYKHDADSSNYCLSTLYHLRRCLCSFGLENRGQIASTFRISLIILIPHYFKS